MYKTIKVRVDSRSAGEMANVPRHADKIYAPGWGLLLLGASKKMGGIVRKGASSGTSWALFFPNTAI